MNETRYPVRVSFRSEREPMEQVKKLANGDGKNIGAVLRRLVVKALKTEKFK